MKIATWSILAAALLVFPAAAPAQSEADAVTCDCDLSHLPGMVWWGNRSQMTVLEVVSYVAPVFWFSPDEPSLYRAFGPAIVAPEPFPFQEDVRGPVVYYQLNKVITDSASETKGYRDAGPDRGEAVIDFESVHLLRLEYFAYFAEEWGLGAHTHDVEPVEFRLHIVTTDDEHVRERITRACDRTHYVIVVARTAGKAHGIEWYWNIVETDEETRFPMTLLVEEGKHALATDKNGDGHFTPTFDVTMRVNDAWGVRDIIRSGGLFAGGYQDWMSKVRHPRWRVMPPLPDDSPLRQDLADRNEEYTRGNAVYQLLPLPPTEEAVAWDAAQVGRSDLTDYLIDKYEPDAPELDEISTIEEAFDWVQRGAFKRTLSLAVYTDGRVGFSWVFPFFVARNLEVPMTGGYVLHRMYVKGPHLRDFGWTALYTPSASRWLDTYLATGVEWHDVGPSGQPDIEADFVLETGLKFRSQIGRTPLRFLTVLTDFWGLRLGVKNYGGFDISRLRYVVEFGAGAF